MFGALSIILYKPWRRRFDRRRRYNHGSELGPEADEMPQELQCVSGQANDHSNLAGGTLDDDRTTATNRHGQGKS